MKGYIRQVQICVSSGELIDRITILELKLEMLSDPNKLRNVKLQLCLLMKVYKDNIIESEDLVKCTDELRILNRKLWDLENSIRRYEKQRKFDQDFVDVARQIYLTNDTRSAIKRRISEITQSVIFEEKEYS